MFGFLNVYKPKGITSHDVVAQLRRATKIKQIGHTGTLDPFAEGVLPICIGKATRLIEYLDDDKEYIATVQFGVNTDTYDLEGEFVETFNKKVFEDEVRDALKNFEGEISQIPPMYSALKVNGKKLYEYAREGKTVDIKSRQVKIYKIELKHFDEKKQTAEILIACSKGTYIRSIAYDLGKFLGCGGHLIKLVRSKAGQFKIEDSIRDFTKNVENNLINPLSVLTLPKIKIDGTEHKKVIQGQSFKKNIENDNCFVILIYNDCIDAVAIVDNGIIKVKKVFI